MRYSNVRADMALRLKDIGSTYIPSLQPCIHEIDQTTGIMTEIDTYRRQPRRHFLHQLRALPLDYD